MKPINYKTNSQYKKKREEEEEEKKRRIENIPSLRTGSIPQSTWPYQLLNAPHKLPSLLSKDLINSNKTSPKEGRRRDGRRRGEERRGGEAERMGVGEKGGGKGGGGEGG